jgi:dephospho-CoA kinase
MPSIGITGGISTGKTTFCRYLRELVQDAEFFDADQAARTLTNHDEEVRRQISEVFGAEIYSGGGDLNRGQLRAIIVESAAKRAALEQILHPRIRGQWRAKAQRYRNSSDFFFADIPLLYETGGETLCDRVVVVACSPALQLARLLARKSTADEPAGTRPFMSKEEAIEMIKTQMPIEEKMRRADHLVWNNDGESILKEQAHELVKLWRTRSWMLK